MTTAVLKRVTVSWRKSGSRPLNPLRVPPIISGVSGMFHITMGTEGNEGKKNDKYKGDLIIEKATGRSTEGEQEDIEFDEGEEEDEEEVREATVAMAGVRVK